MTPRDHTVTPLLARTEIPGTRRGRPMTDPKPAVWLTRRPEFLAAAKGRRHHAALFTIQARRRTPSEGPARFGLTVTAKTGNAVERNRIKRRLRAAIRETGRATATAGFDFVIIGRRDLLQAPFPMLLSELVAGLKRLSSEPTKSSSPSQQNH